MLNRVGFTTSANGIPPLELPDRALSLPAVTTQAERVAALIAADEAAWQQPLSKTIRSLMDWLRKYQTAVLIAAAGLFALALFRGRR
jgi:hypothetical protein